MQRGISDAKQIDAWVDHLRKNNFRVEHERHWTQLRPYRNYSSSTYRNRDKKPYSVPKSQGAQPRAELNDRSEGSPMDASDHGAARAE